MRTMAAGVTTTPAVGFKVRIQLLLETSRCSSGAGRGNPEPVYAPNLDTLTDVAQSIG